MSDKEIKIPGRERVSKSMLGVYDVAVELSKDGCLPSADGGRVLELIRALESGANRFDVEIEQVFGEKITLHALIELVIDKCIKNSESSKRLAGQETEYSKKLDAFWRQLKEVTYGDLDKDRTIH